MFYRLIPKGVNDNHHVFTSHMVVIVHHVVGKDMCVGWCQTYCIDPGLLALLGG